MEYNGTGYIKSVTKMAMFNRICKGLRPEIILLIFMISIASLFLMKTYIVHRIIGVNQGQFQLNYINLSRFTFEKVKSYKASIANIFETNLISTQQSWMNPSFCTVNCKVGTPCSYKDTVDFRIIVMTYDRPESLKKCLISISKVDVMNLKVSVEIWIDRGKDGKVITKAVEYSEDFRKTWKNGRVCIHQRETNAYIDGQWIDTWRPKSNSTKEIALILEDDVDIAKQSLRWLRAVHMEYDKRDDIAGYTLTMQSTRFFRGNKGAMIGPLTDNVFLYGVIGTWGYSPHPGSWRNFQDWFHTKDKSVKPYVPNIVPTNWFQSFEKQHRERSMWEMWHIYFCYKNQHFTMFCNLHYKTKKKSDILLAWNRQEPGLHFGGKKNVAKTPWDMLLQTWDSSYIEFPPNGPVRFSYEGNILKDKQPMT